MNRWQKIVLAALTYLAFLYGADHIANQPGIGEPQQSCIDDGGQRQFDQWDNYVGCIRP